MDLSSLAAGRQRDLHYSTVGVEWVGPVGPLTPEVFKDAKNGFIYPQGEGAGCYCGS